MTKTTTTLFEVIASELNKKGYNEFYQCNTIDFSDGNLNYMRRITRYDEEVEIVVNRTIFREFEFENKELDKWFKKAFVNKFLNRQIAQQTIESFANILIYEMLSHEHFIVSLYENMEEYLTNGNHVNSNRTHDNRHATATLPQSQVNINVDNTLLDYADNNDISRDKDVSNQDTTNFDLDTLMKSFPLFDQFFRLLDKRCFLQVW